MKRFRFPAQALLDWRKKLLEATEDELGKLEARRRSSLDRAAACEAESIEALERLDAGVGLTGRDLRQVDAWRDNLALESMAATEAARRLDAQATEVRCKLVKQSRDVKLLERLHKRRFREHRKEQDKRQEELAAEVHRAARRKD